MARSAPPVLSADDVWEIAQEVWESMLGLSAVRADHAFGLDGAVTASVELHGEWSGMVSVTCPPASALAVTRAMLDLPVAAEPEAADVDDVMGEIANVLGGNVKALVPGGARLGLPRVGSRLVPMQAESLCRTGVEWSGHVARIGVWRLASPVYDAGSGARR